MTTTVTGLFENFHEAERAAEALISGGLHRSAVSVREEMVETQPERAREVLLRQSRTRWLLLGTGMGTYVGGLMGVIAGTYGLATPMTEFIVVESPLLAAIAGAILGGGIGSAFGVLAGKGLFVEPLRRTGQPARRRGGLVTAVTMDDVANPTARFLQNFGAVEVHQQVVAGGKGRTVLGAGGRRQPA